jgi:hypothetical protein
MVQQTLPEKPQMSQKRHLPKINKHPDQTQPSTSTFCQPFFLFGHFVICIFLCLKVPRSYLQ